MIPTYLKGMESGSRVPAEEKKLISTLREVLHVSYQKNAYKDERVELRVLANYRTHLRAEFPNDDEFLLVQDGLAAHSCSAALEYDSFFPIRTF